MKKIIKRTPISVLVFTLMLILLFPNFASAASEIKEINYVTYAEKVITSLYENKDLGANNALGADITPNLSIYLEDKVKTNQYATKLNKTYKTNYKINITLLEEKTLIDKIFLKFNVQTYFNYVDLPNIDSGRGEVVEVIIDSDNYKIIDIYNQNDYYDSFVRGESIDIIKENSNIVALSKSDTIKKKQIELKNTINKTYEEEMNSTLENPPPISRASSSLNKNAIASYARNNYYKTNPASGNGVVPYYDFSQISGNYDCTNFVSHALLAGGATVYDTGNSGISSTGWYYRNTSNRSSSWSGVVNLHNFLIGNITKGPWGVSNSYSTRIGDFANGDIIQFNNGSIWRHSTIVTGYYTMDDRQGALVTGRSASGAYNNNEKAADIYAGYAKRTISVFGNY